MPVFLSKEEIEHYQEFLGIGGLVYVPAAGSFYHAEGCKLLPVIACK